MEREEDEEEWEGSNKVHGRRGISWRHCGGKGKGGEKVNEGLCKGGDEEECRLVVLRNRGVKSVVVKVVVVVVVGVVGVVGRSGCSVVGRKEGRE